MLCVCLSYKHIGIIGCAALVRHMGRPLVGVDPKPNTAVAAIHAVRLKEMYRLVSMLVWAAVN